MAEENQRMQDQIAQLVNARLEHNNDHHNRDENHERQSMPTHISETPQQEEEEAQPDAEDKERDNSADSILRFQELARQFEDHFAASTIYLHDSDYLTTIKQGPQESLKDYITRFTKVTMRIPDLHPEVHLHAIKSGLRPSKFQETIAVTKPKTLAEFHEKAKGQIDVEELRQARKTEKSVIIKDDDKPRDSKKPFKSVPRYDSYTKFNAKRDDIIKEILNSKLIKPPRKAGAYRESKAVDKSKYCTFHQKYGHTTNECVIAKDLLERLARQGHLDKFIAGHMQKNVTSAFDPSAATPSSKEKDKAPAQHRGIINYISGGYAGGRNTSSARKRTYRAMLAVTDAPKVPQPNQHFPEMTFRSTDFTHTDANYDDPVVISVQLGDLIVRKVLLNPGSSADVLFFTTFEKMKLSSNILQPYHGDLVGFSGERVPVLGSVWLQTTLGEQPLFKTQDIQYLVVDCFSPYNLILGRPFLNRFAAIVSTVYLCVKFPVQDNEVATIYGDLQEARQCYNISLKPIKKSNMAQVNFIQPDQSRLTEIDPRADFEDQPMPNEDLMKVLLTDDPMKFTFVGTTISKEEKDSLIRFLRENADLFAWTPADMPEIDTSIITHKLAINHEAWPISQKKRNLGAEKRLASLAEVKKLITANFIREIRFTTWLANVVMAKKSNGATYQRLMNKVFENQIGRNIEVYVDDMVAKTIVGNTHVKDLVEIFGKSLQGADLRYPRLEKLALALVFSSRRLRPYFQGHTIIIKTEQPLRQILSKSELAGRLTKWAIELSEFDIQYQPRGSVKSQYLADFVAELTQPGLEEEFSDWTLFVDGASNPQGSGAGILLESPESIILEHSLRFSFKASNNQAEYEALVAGLRNEADLVLAEAHGGICGIHSGARSLAQKILRAGFYWPSLWEDSRKKNLKINQHFSSVEHPQSNGLAKAANKVLLHALRKKLDDAKGLWAELVPEVLWSYNTTVHTSTKETPFRLVYGSEAMIPLEISQQSLRTQAENHDQARQAELNLIEEVRNTASIRHRALQQQLGRRHAKRVQPRSFNIGDLVLRKTEEARRPPSHGKLAATWDGPYRVLEVLGRGAYRLEHLDGTKLPSTWNINSLKQYYS
ncbi:uncharacterized protein [Arachis hypogaea]|uniref:uncharacterized protein n=1 Tax=Arachis hypogaea TaxID=3818 RepID=UPI003B223CE9